MTYTVTLHAAVSFSAIWKYSKEHFPLTLCLFAGILLALLAIVLLFFQKGKLKREQKKAENAAIFLQTLEKEQQARDKAEAEAKAKEEEEERRKKEKSLQPSAQEQALIEPIKYCLFCGKAAPALLQFCEECAGTKFGTKEEYEARQNKRTKERVEKQTRKKIVEELGVATTATVPPSAEEKEASPPVEEQKPLKYAGKWLVYRICTDEEENGEEAYFFELRASNGEKLFASEEYTSYSGAVKGIETHKTNIANDNFRIVLSKKGDYLFKLLSGKNTLLCTGENYPTQARCESAVESVKRFAATALLDEDLHELLIKPAADNGAPLPALPENCSGKWIIGNKEGVNGERVFYFDLFANNGEKLLSSEEYTSYIGAINGITTHKKNIENGNFRISLTKRGDYVVKLLNGNGQLLCLGEHYKTKRLGQNAVESVKRFALASPVLTDEQTAKL